MEKKRSAELSAVYAFSGSSGGRSAADGVRLGQRWGEPCSGLGLVEMRVRLEEMEDEFKDALTREEEGGGNDGAGLAEMRRRLEETRERLIAKADECMRQREEAEMAAIREASICMMKDYGFATCTLDEIPFWARDHV